MYQVFREHEHLLDVDQILAELDSPRKTKETEFSSSSQVVNYHHAFARYWVQHAEIQAELARNKESCHMPDKFLLYDKTTGTAPSERWPHWIRDLEFYFASANITDDRQKKTSMIICAGPDVQTLYEWTWNCLDKQYPNKRVHIGEETYSEAVTSILPRALVVWDQDVSQTMLAAVLK
jgi:hypothetical protein